MRLSKSGAYETLELVQARFDSGLVPKLDLTQARSNLATSESLIPLLDTALILAYNRLDQDLWQRAREGLTGRST